MKLNLIHRATSTIPCSTFSPNAFSTATSLTKVPKVDGNVSIGESKEIKNRSNSETIEWIKKQNIKCSQDEVHEYTRKNATHWQRVTNETLALHSYG